MARFTFPITHELSKTRKCLQSLNEPGSTATWHFPAHSSKEVQGWRHIRIQQTGKNASGQTHYLSLSGLELYGSVTGVCEELGKNSISPGDTRPELARFRKT
jgi:hypothetical protein